MARLLAAADSAVLVELGDAVSDASTAAVLALGEALRAAPPAGMSEVIPGLCSLLVEYDPRRTSRTRLCGDLERLMQPKAAITRRLAGGHEHVITVSYGGDAGPDLEIVARGCGLTAAEVIRLHTAATHRVAMLGNQPGLPYLLGLDRRLVTPRRNDPRDAVPPGSVAVAGELSCIYPAAGPGGWHLLGRTDAALFDPTREPAALLAPGDTVRFIASTVEMPPAPERAPQSPPAVGDRTPALLVLEPGLLTTVQDGGRKGYQRLGVPVSGALDGELLHVANLLAGNGPNDAALEVTHAGPLLQVRGHSVRIAVAGDAELTRIDATGTARAAQCWRSLVLRDGERLRVGRVRRGLRCIVAVEGGIATAPVLGSRSTYLRSAFGGVQGRALQCNDVLPLHRAYAGHHPDLRLDATALHDAGLIPPPRSEVVTVRAVAGPHEGALTPDSLRALFATEFTVSPRSDRVGLRLDGLRLSHPGSSDIIPEGCAHGAVQVPGSGQPIVLLADRGTTGGYPVAATVASADLPLVARLRPGARLRLQRIEVAEAEAARRGREAALATLRQAMEPVAGV